MELETLFKISDLLDCKYEVGIWSEANNFLQRQEIISEFTLEFNKDEEIYIVSIMLSEYSLKNVKDIFYSFVRFIEYDSTFYIKEDSERTTKYSFVSATKDRQAFLFQITFQ
ncbi:hypothetical protein I6N90_10945 [Paenibacillus sp. GSMTC-2017]|uniref:hypothetical protein n=1 Tax=Paenibacillus sp. GSMTC-2017 TaxID=2794350 RepID=UPI0018D87D35|nr:hypothetical protein [Paenibacillus sp. GSMTC-2017]MBH5318325.1 hypothetical protein [Paenibacillus sp. GSMTC-2017]